jgi:L-threonylcarbamoyladenylate synthase
MRGAQCETVGIGGPDGLNPALHRASHVLLGGGVILYPTDTIYGLGCLAGNPAAVERLYAIKGKPDTKPSLVLVDSVAMASAMTTDPPPLARRLMDLFWPGPLTLVLTAAPAVSPLLTAGSGKIGVRLPADEFCRRLALRCESPLVSTSANRSGVPPVAAVTALIRQFSVQIDLAVDGGERVSPPSTVVDVSAGELRIIREGAISATDLARALSTRP